MTELPCPPFTLAVEAGPGAVRLCLAGDLDYDSTEELVERAQACLAADPGLRDLFLDCSGLRLCDSTGVSGLLLIHRGTTSRGVALHLENAPGFLRRILDVTGTHAALRPRRGRGPGRTGGGGPAARRRQVPGRPAARPLRLTRLPGRLSRSGRDRRRAEGRVERRIAAEHLVDPRGPQEPLQGSTPVRRCAGPSAGAPR